MERSLQNNTTKSLKLMLYSKGSTITCKGKKNLITSYLDNCHSKVLVWRLMVGGNPSAGLEKVIVLLEETFELLGETLMQQRSINPFIERALDKQWDLERDSKQSQVENEEFRISVLDFYGLSTSNTLPSGKDLIHCHFLGLDVPFYTLTCSHIFPKRFSENDWVPCADLDDHHNTLFMFKSIERAFDRGRLCFVWEHTTSQFRIHILDPSLAKTTLRRQTALTNPKLTLPVIPVFDPNTGKQLLDSSNKPLDLLDKTFNDFHGKYLKFKNAERPYKRCLSFQAHRARHKAIKKKWISNTELPELDEIEAWSPDSQTDTKLLEIIKNWKLE